MVEHFRQAFGMSVRRACHLASIHRKTYHYHPRADRNEALRKRLRELSERYSRYGSPMLYLLLRREGMVVNHKRVERLYREERLSLRLKQRRKRTGYVREAMPVPDMPDVVWSMDFIHDALASGRGFKCLTMVDHCTRESPGSRVDHSIRGKDVVQVLERLRRKGRKPSMIVVDNGPEFRSKALALWAAFHDVRLYFIDPGKPIQNAFIESFNSRIRAECLNAQWFSSLEQARLVIEAWRKEYEQDRPHGSLGGKTPKEVANEFFARLSEPRQSLRSSLVT